MINFSVKPIKTIQFDSKEISSFIHVKDDENIDWKTVKSFGEEWSKFSQFSQKEIQEIGYEYFDILEESILPKESCVLDVGCGSGRWSKYLSDKVGYIEAVDPSKAVFVASKLLEENKNVRVSQASVDNLPFEDETFDLVFSLGVLHHIPDTGAAMKKCVKKVKRGGFFLVYLYYKIDDLPLFHRILFFIADLVRNVIYRLPLVFKKLICDIISLIIYKPLSFIASLTKKIIKGNAYKKIPLWYYHNKSFNIMRNDALDRFGTPLEQRFSKKEIESMMKDSGLCDIIFSKNAPYWHAIGKRL